jgi:hypothetical protein
LRGQWSLFHKSYFSYEAIPGISEVRSTNGESTSADAVTSGAVVLDLALVETASGITRGVTIEHGGSDVVRVNASACNGVGDYKAALRVAPKRDLGIRAIGFGLLDELCHDWASLTALLDVAGDGSFVVDALDGDTVGAEGFLKSFGEGRAD